MSSIIAQRLPLSRRCFLRGTGVTTILAWLDAGQPLCSSATTGGAAFVSQLADYVKRWHLQKDESPLRGTLHELEWPEESLRRRIPPCGDSANSAPTLLVSYAKDFPSRQLK